MVGVSKHIWMCSAVALAGCSSGVSTQIDPDPIDPNQDELNQVSSALPLMQYEAKYFDGVNDNFAELQSADGVVFYLGNRDGTISETRIRYDAATETLFVAQDGGAEAAYPVKNPLNTDPGEGYGSFENASGDLFTIDLYDDDCPSCMWSGHLELYEPEGDSYTMIGFGPGGILTPLDDLPDAASYSGTLLLRTERNSGVNANMTLNLDFVAGDISGSVSRGSYYDDTEYQFFFGDIDGTIIGSRIGGTVFVDGDATGELEFTGGVMGDAGQDVNGAMKGTLTAEGKATVMGGYFNVSQ